jgi:ABC-2 type transport system ATP-binding protein
MSSIVEVQNLHKQYDPPEGAKAVKGVSFEIQQGEIFSLLGPNGAGKTTLLSILSGLLTPTSGEALINKHSIIKEPKQVKQVLGLVPQEIALYNTLSARENLVFWGKMYGLAGQHLEERVAAALEIAGLVDRASDKLNTFSGGMRRRINVAIGLLHEPQVLYLDEPTVGIDPQSRRRILDTVKELNAGGMTILYTTHYMEEAEELSHRIGIMDHGELIAMGTLEELNKSVGQYDTIRLDLDAAYESNGSLVEILSQIPNVDRVFGEENVLVLQTQDASEILPLIMKKVAESGTDVKQMSIQEPNLEAVFLNLTGRALRD